MSQADFERTRHIALTHDAWTDRLIDAYERRLAMAGPARAGSFTDWRAGAARGRRVPQK